MDATNLIFYGLVCGLLSWAGPKLGGAPIRFGIGILVGVIAATALPSLKALIGA